MTDVHMESSAAVKRQRSDCPGNVPQSDNVSNRLDARLQQLRGSQQHRISSESTKEREAHI